MGRWVPAEHDIILSLFSCSTTAYVNTCGLLCPIYVAQELHLYSSRWIQYIPLLLVDRCRQWDEARFFFPSIICCVLSTSIVNQIEIHPFVSWDECVEVCQREDIAVMAYSPLAQAGKLSNPSLVDIAKR